MNETTLILISYKSEKKIYSFIKNIPLNIKIIIIENSNNTELKKKVEEKYKNISVYLKKNEGVSSSLNFAAKHVKTKYFLQISPDVIFDFKDLDIFLYYAEKFDNKFAAIGPRFNNVKEKSHKQIKNHIEFDKIDSIHGSCMFINKNCFEEIGGFDDNFFLYFEETEYCYRAKKRGFLTYQINKSNVLSQGRSVEIKDNEQEDKFANVLIWHFIWSKFYFNKLRYGTLITLIIFTPTLIRIIFKLLFFKILNNKKNIYKYTFRLNGLITSILNKKSNLRP
jgi:GT2 family glycosyltransferase